MGAGKTQVELSVESQVALRSIASYEADEVMPGSDGLARLAKALDVSTDVLLGLVRHPSSVDTPASAVESAS